MGLVGGWYPKGIAKGSEEDRNGRITLLGVNGEGGGENIVYFGWEVRRELRRELADRCRIGLKALEQVLHHLRGIGRCGMGKLVVGEELVGENGEHVLTGGFISFVAVDDFRRAIGGVEDKTIGNGLFRYAGRLPVKGVDMGVVFGIYPNIGGIEGIGKDFGSKKLGHRFGDLCQEVAFGSK